MDRNSKAELSITKIIKKIFDCTTMHNDSCNWQNYQQIRIRAGNPVPVEIITIAVNALKRRFNNQINSQRFIENVNKPSTFYCININPQYIIFLKLKLKTFKKYKIMFIY